MSKMKKKYKLALALGGGGARGLAHIGVLKALERAGIKFDLIVGTSMGAIAGSMYAQNPVASEVEAKVLNFLDVFLEDKQWIRTMDPELSSERQSLLTGISHYVQRRYLALKAMTRVALEPIESLMEPLREIIDDNNIEDCHIPFAAVSIDITNGKPVVLDRGPIIDAVYASAAIEGVFPPLEYDGVLLSDGGPVNLTPVDIALQLGADRVIAVDVHQEIRRIDKFTNGLEIIMRADNIGLYQLCLQEIGRADLVISPDVAAIHWASFSKARDCIRLGEIAAQKAIPEAKKITSRTYWMTRIKKRFSGLSKSD
jgi:NTE family protein